MKRISSAIGVVALLAAVGGLGHQAFAAHPGQASSPTIQLTNPIGMRTVSQHGKLAVDVKVTGIMLDKAHIGMKDQAGHGHYHFYIDCIPADAYVKVDLSRCYAGNDGGMMGVFNLAKAPQMMSKGVHVLLVALANNNHILVRAPASAILISVK